MDFEEYVIDLNADCKCGCMYGDRFHKIYRFPNGLGASVIGLGKKIGSDERGYRILLIKFTGDLDYIVVTTPMFDSSILECDSWEQAAERLKMIKDM